MMRPNLSDEDYEATIFAMALSKLTDLADPDSDGIESYQPKPEMVELLATIGVAPLLKAMMVCDARRGYTSGQLVIKYQVPMSLAARAVGYARRRP